MLFARLPFERLFQELDSVAAEFEADDHNTQMRNIMILY